MLKGTANSPNLDALHASSPEPECELFGGSTCGDYVIDHSDMTIRDRVQSKRLAQIFLSLLLVQPRLSRCGAYALQAVAIHGNVLEPADGVGQFCCLVITPAPLPPPVQRHRQQHLRWFIQIETGAEQASQ